MNEERTFQPGDRVKHKSGGPVMVVSQIRENRDVACRWHDGKEQKFVKGFFNPAELEHVSDKDYYEPDEINI